MNDSVNKYDEIFSNIIDELKGQLEIDCVNKLDILVKYTVYNYHLTLNKYSLLSVDNKTTLPRDKIARFYSILREKIKSKILKRKLKERRILMKFMLEYMDDFETIIQQETPDFVIDSCIGVEVLGYEIEENAVLENQYLYKRTNESITLSEMEDMLESKRFNKLIKIMNPSIDTDEDTIIGYTVPGLNITDINQRKRYFVNEVLNKKLIKYETGKYKRLNTNYLLVFLEFSSCIRDTEKYNVVEKIINKYPNIVSNYDLKIIVLEPHDDFVIDLNEKKITSIKRYYELIYN